jgi:serine/threonine protein kinase
MNRNDFDTIGDLPTISSDNGMESKLLADRYRIIRKLGEGGMGLVYLAEDTELGNNKVAIKFIPPQLAGNARAIKNLQREAQTAMQLSHPNIVRLHDMHTDGHQKFLVMEYIEGKTLDDLLAEKEGGKLTLEEVLPIAEQIAAGLDYAHSRKVLHRDLKPSNIMIDKNSTAKLLDFGIAREMKDSYTRITGNETSGTLPYMSPEQLMGENPTPAMDIYSFGAVLYECLSGHPPFYMGDIREQIRLKEPLPIEDVSADINKALAASLAKNKSARYSSAVELTKSLLIGAFIPKTFLETEKTPVTKLANEQAEKKITRPSARVTPLIYVTGKSLNKKDYGDDK